jgi:ribosomal-protein-alanine N-acetyltransferase
LSRRPGWPARLEGPAGSGLVVRSLRRRDAAAWREVRERNREWLGPWDATPPPGGQPRPASYGVVVRELLGSARAGRSLPFVIEVDGGFGGQVTVSNIARGSAQFASIGYWIDRAHAGRGLVPMAVAMVIDHCFSDAGLHRIEVCVRPENTNSLRVVEKLEMEQIGFAPRFLHIDGAWRDHRIFAVTTEEVPGGMVARLLSNGSQ